MNTNIIKLSLFALIIIALITPLIYSFTFFNGFAGQIKATDYPADWYEVNDLLNQDNQDFKILFFPWHGYMDFKWINNTDKRIANPSRNFFDKEVIRATTVELGKIYRQDNAPDQLYIDSMLKDKSNITNFGELVTILNVKYVILAKEVDYIKYNFLFNQNDLELVKETENLYVFRNKGQVVKIYQTDDINNIAGKEEVKYKTISPVRIQIEGTNRKYLVFTEPYSKDWKLDGKEPVKAYGAVNAYENGGKEIRFERFYKVNLPAYIISILAFVGMIAVYLGLQWRKKKMPYRHDSLGYYK